MPQASDELRAKFPAHDEQAREVLGLDHEPVEERRWTETGGWIRPTRQSSLDTMTEREGDAIDYLVDEWDYAYSPTPAATWPPH